MSDKRAAALAAFDHLLDSHRRALATSEKALNILDELKTLLSRGGEQLAGAASRLEADYAAQLAEVSYRRAVVVISEYEREVLFGAEKQAPQPCPEWPDCGDDEGPCYACSEYRRHLDAVETAREVSDAG